MDLYENLRINLRALREGSSLTQQILSERIGLPRANIARYETGENVPPLDVLAKYADFFDTTIDELLGRLN